MRIWVTIFVAVLAFVLSSCGRSGLGERCSGDSECRNGFFCSDGFCAAENNATNNATNGCTLDCCGDGCPTNNVVDCYENAGGVCVSDVACDLDADGENSCTTMPCDVGCPPNSVQEGCECAEIVCGTDDDCAPGLLCLDGICDACKTDGQCADGEVCSEGACVPNDGCSGDSDCPPDQRCAADGVCRDRPQCVFDGDCTRGQLCFNGRCTLAPECQVDLDCPQGQECVGGNCFIALCRGPEDCLNSELCDAGECVTPPTVGSCLVATPSQLIAEGQRVALEAFAFDQQGGAIAASFVWTSSLPGVARSVPGPTALGGTDQGTASLTAVTANGIACSGEALLTNPGPVAPNTIRVIVADIESNAAVANATVRVGMTSETTDARGVATLPDPGTAYEVSVFHDDFNWLTVQNVSATDIRIPLRRSSGSGPVSGFTGQFDTSRLHSSGNITLGLAGASIAGGLLELGLDRLLGDTFVSRLEIPGVVDTDIPLPGGLIAYGGAFGFQADIKKTYYAQTAGGPRIAWGLAGLLPFGELLDFFMGGGFEGTEILAQLLPLFNRFDHSAFPSVMVELPRIVDSADIDRDGDTAEILPDYEAFPVINMTPSVRQNLVTGVAVSNFPVLSDGPTGIAVLVGGAVLPSPGFVPTGISATSDEDGDGRPDLQRLSIAPAYGPLVGGRYAIVAITFGGGGGGPGGPGGFELPEEFSVALWSGQRYPTSLSLGTFPDGSQSFVTDATRQVSVTSSAGPMFRVRMVGADRTWDVWSLGPPGSMGQFGTQIQVPAPPVNGTDLFVSGRILIDAIQTNVDIDDLVSSSGVGLKNAGLVTSAYNRSVVR